MPTRTQQGDILLCAYASHGDTKHILLFPANPAECFTFAVKAFDLAERFQTPVFMLSDLDIGMNDWVVPRLTWDDAYRPDRGRVLTAAELEAMPASSSATRPDDDNVAARTLPGVHPKGAFFTRGSGHNKLGGTPRIPDEYQEVVDRLLRASTRARPSTCRRRSIDLQWRCARAPRLRHRDPRRLRRAPCARRSRPCAPRAWPPTTCASARFRSATRSTDFLGQPPG